MKGLPHYELGANEYVLSCISKNDEAETPHDHGFYEMMAILSGSGTHWINGVAYNVLPGDVFLLNIGDVHYLRPNDSAVPFQWIVVGWRPTVCALEDSLLLNGKRYIDRNPMHITNLMLDLLYEVNTKPPDYLDVVRYQLMVILTKLKRLVAEPEETSTGQRRRNIIKQATNFIQENYVQSLSLKSISEQLDISQVYLCKLFNEEVGVGAIQYLRKVRIDQAAALLRTTDKKVGRIAVEVGFQDAKSFYTVFKSHMGVTPAAYRSHHRRLQDRTP